MIDVVFAESAFEAQRLLRAVLGMNLFSLFLYLRSSVTARGCLALSP